MKKNIFENENYVSIFTVRFAETVLAIMGILDGVFYIQSMTADGTDFKLKGYAIPKNVLNSQRYAELFTGYWYLQTLQGLKCRRNALAVKKDKTEKDRYALEAIKLPIEFTESVIKSLGFNTWTYPETIKSTVWAVNSGAWKSADGGTRYWVKGGKGLADDIATYAKGRMSKADFKQSYCNYTAQWLQTAENGDAETFGDLFRNFTPKATDIMCEQLVNCFKGVKDDYKEDGITLKGMRGQALVAQAVLKMLKTVYKFGESKKEVVDAEI